MRQVVFFCCAIIFLVLSVVPAVSQEATPEAAETPVVDPYAGAPAWDGTLRRIAVPILMYHYVSPLPEGADDIRRELTISPEAFRAHLTYLTEQGYSTISLYDLDLALVQGTELPDKPIILSFDDGHIDHYQYVFPLLQEFNMTGTFFIITALADSQNPLHLNWSQIREMSDAGMSMEAHTKNHASLRERSRDFLVYEMLGSLESMSIHNERPTYMLSYPVGHYDNLTLEVGRELGIWRAVTTERGTQHTTHNRLLLPRVRVNGGIGAAGLDYILNTDF